MEVYRDRVVYVETNRLIAYRGGSIELNTLKAYVEGLRVCKDGCWAIVSQQGDVDRSRMEMDLKMVEAGLGDCGGIAEARLFRGRVELGRSDIDVETLVREVKELCGEAKALGVSKCEIVVNVKSILKAIEREDGERAEELRNVAEIEVGLAGVAPSGRPSYGSSFRASILWNPQDLTKLVDNAMQQALDVLRKSGAAKPLSIYMIGRTTVVLDPIATAALFHEVSHMLDPTYGGGVKRIGVQIGPPELEVYDDPKAVESPAIRFFDDECVVTGRRHLIEDGRIVDLHHTRNTAKIYGSEPGSAYGLFSSPVPFHTTLVVKTGDWRENEILEDTQRGIYVEGASMAVLEAGYIRIVPEVAYVVERGELKEAIRVKNVKIPIAKLRTINAISKTHKLRVSYEKNWLVAEIAPMIRVEGYVE